MVEKEVNQEIVLKFAEEKFKVSKKSMKMRKQKMREPIRRL